MSSVLLPLDVLLQTMRRKWENGDYDGAVSLARIAAPYLHPKQTSPPHNMELRLLSDDELSAVCADADDYCTGQHNTS